MSCSVAVSSGAVQFPVDLLDAGDGGVESLPVSGGVFEAAPVAVQELGCVIDVEAGRDGAGGRR